MSVAWALKQGRAHALPAPERMLLVILAYHANSGGSCCPGQAAIAVDTGLVQRHIRRLTDSLVERGLIRLERRGRVLHYHIVRANGMDPDPKKQRTQSPVSKPEIADTQSAIDPPIPDSGSAIEEPTPDPESGIPGQYRTPRPVFGPKNAILPSRAPAQTLTSLKKEEREVGVPGEGEERERGAGEREGRTVTAEPKRGHKLPKAWSPNAYSISLGTELGFSMEQIHAEAASMRDWSLSVNKFRHDWDRQFNNWLRKEAKDRAMHNIRTRPKQTLEQLWGLGSFLTPTFDDDDQIPPSGRLQ
jgi:hypothetical protein